VQWRSFERRGRPLPVIVAPAEQVKLVDANPLIGPLWTPAQLDRIEDRLQAMTQHSAWRFGSLGPGQALERAREAQVTGTLSLVIRALAL
jgi:hypothetical protein